jgi:hypothetical protein
MTSSKGGNSEHPFLAFLNRWAAVFWFSVFIATPIVFSLCLYGAYYKRRRAKLKEERKYWSDEIKLDWLWIYITFFFYVIVTQDFLLYPFSFEHKEVIMDGFKAVFGLPGYFWFRIFGGPLDPDDCCTASLVMAFLISTYYAIKIHWWKPNGDRDSGWKWKPSRKGYAAMEKQYNKEEAQFNALMAEQLAHNRNHPSNENDWKKLSPATQKHLLMEWEEKRDAIRAEMDVCPRSKVFKSK